MPTTKTLTIKQERNLQRAIEYILNPEKTKNQTLTSGYKLNAVNNAFFEMSLTRRLATNIKGQSNKKTTEEVLARHIIQSFDPADNLTPEEVHEIGRQTALEFLGEDYEFVIATHVDKDHLHNHIIFNATSTVDLKKFRWQKRTTADLRYISDKVADYHGASILQSAKRNSYAKYQEYCRKNAYRVEIKERLNFLLNHSISWEDFLVKAKLLNLAVDPIHKSKEYGKVINYKLLDLPQERPARDYTLNKKRRSYNEEKIRERTSKNDPKAVCGVLEIAKKYEEQKKEKEELADLTFIIEPWQIEKDTMTGIYVEIAYGRYETGIVKIPDFMLEKKEDGRYEAHFNYKDTFYFLSDDSIKKNKFVKGSSLASYLSGENGLFPKRKNSAIQNVREMVAALNILSARQVSSEQVPKILGQDFYDNYEIVQEARSTLNDKLYRANEKLKFDPTNQELKEKVKALHAEKNDLEKQVKIFEKQMKTYDSALSILTERGLSESADLEK
ncbi:relaxase/mobilization nuclease domain-containing protein [Enterococcus gallinarum]|uniref:relaxase/mobilization nuclease domain-containing protein n=1 Tax=Enterococcus gallinarum TaxID=1353 RepID=UPI0018AC11F0|nr:relaxase/mobilization nuclease domain-containing protein [Enterococcus gallinarum]